MYKMDDLSISFNLVLIGYLKISKTVKNWKPIATNWLVPESSNDKLFYHSFTTLIDHLLNFWNLWPFFKSRPKLDTLVYFSFFFEFL